ncbi:MAG: type II secretion system F family protein [Candidatus Marinimicrobia bacterium]|nr:type II secretion system F family protein [Candidatus Neomarinimicrobiota bacterium]MCF7902485.1 type II secretion system F family protein [Candidatus Neomarinimicrobiota bacterium]
MGEFIVKMTNEAGEIVEQEMTAATKFDIFEIAESRNMMVLNIREQKTGSISSIDAWLGGFRKLKDKELEQFTSQLAAMLRAGITLVDSLETIQEQVDNPNFAAAIKTIIFELNSGSTFADALGKYPNYFPEVYRGMVMAGERAGVLETILKRLETYLHYDNQTKARIKSAMRYPTFVLIALTLAFVAVMVFVIPQFAKMFEAQQVQLPLPTRIMLGTSNLFANYWWATGLVVLGVFVGLMLYFRTPAGQYTADVWKLRLPVVKVITRKNLVARFAQLLETLSRSGIQIIEALQIISQTLGNAVVAKEIQNAEKQVLQGVAVADSLKGSQIFPKTVLKMISVGEKSGALDEMLGKIAEQYDEELNQTISRLSSMIEPIMTVVMGVFLLMMALGIFLPMWGIYENALAP